ncbi:MAG: hypothetical protein WB662_17110 [Methyloceanibacter sp.]
MVNFNLLENDLSDALWRLTRINEKHTSDIVLGQLRSFESLVHMFAQLANQRFTDQATRKKIKRLAHRMDTGNRRRNDLIHGRWVAFGPKSSIIRFQQQPNIAKWRIIATSPSEIRGDAIKLIRTQLALRRFIAVIQKRNDRDRRASLRKKS